jgi:leucine-zipper of insertion element IS481
MVQKVVPMQVKLAAVLAEASQADRIDVRATCRALGISRATYYKYAARFTELGVEGLVERSRRPQTCPGRTAAGVEELIVRWRKALLDEGWDAGAQSIYHRMHRAGQDPPSVRTIHRGAGAVRAGGAAASQAAA